MLTELRNLLPLRFISCPHPSLPPFLVSSHVWCHVDWKGADGGQSFGSEEWIKYPTSRFLGSSGLRNIPVKYSRFLCFNALWDAGVLNYWGNQRVILLCDQEQALVCVQRVNITAQPEEGWVTADGGSLQRNTVHRAAPSSVQQWTL